MIRIVWPRSVCAMTNQKILIRLLDGDEACFAKRVVRIRERQGEWLAEHARSFFKAYAVLAQIGGRFWRVPFKREHEPAAYPINPSTGDEAEA
jgi:hypothetical protein